MLTACLLLALVCISRAHGSFVNNFCIKSCQSRSDGQYLNCERCDRYVMCSGSYLYSMPCPSTTRYNGVLGVCVTDYIPGCFSGHRLNPLEPGRESPGGEQSTSSTPPTTTTSAPTSSLPPAPPPNSVGQPYEPPGIPGNENYYVSYYPLNSPNPPESAPTTTHSTIGASPARKCNKCSETCADATKEVPVIIRCSDCCFVQCFENLVLCA